MKTILNWRFIQALTSAALIAWLLSKVDYWASLKSLTEARFSLVLLAVLASFIQWAMVNTLCWYVLLRAVHVRIDFLRLARANFSGLFYSLVLPGQVSGDLIKGMQLAAEKQQSVQFLVSILMDRVTGFWVTLALTTLAAFTTNWISLWGSSKTLGAALAFLLILSLLFFFRPLLNFWSTVLLLLSRLRLFRLAGKHLLTLSACIQQYYLSSPHVLTAVLISALSVLAGSTIVFIGACSIGIHLPFWIFLFVTGILSAIQTLPISVAGIGVREVSYVFLLEPFGVPSESSLALSAMMFAVFVVTAICGGILELYDSIQRTFKSRHFSERSKNEVPNGKAPTR
jgi:glycosyltransferase 2 family protein